MSSGLLDALDRQEAVRGELRGWRPEREGETVIGTLIGYRTANTHFGKAEIAVIRQDSEPIGVWLTTTVLKNAWKEAAPEIGDEVAVRYGGRHPKKQYHLYTVACERNEAARPSAPARLAATQKATPYADKTISRPAPEPDVDDPFCE